MLSHVSSLVFWISGPGRGDYEEYLLVTPCSWEKVRCFRETYGLQSASSSFFLGLSFSPGDGGDKFLRTTEVSFDYITSQPGRPYCSLVLLNAAAIYSQWSQMGGTFETSNSHLWLQWPQITTPLIHSYIISPVRWPLTLRTIYTYYYTVEIVRTAVSTESQAHCTKTWRSNP